MTPTSIISKRVVVVSAFALMLFAAFATPIFAVDKQANVAARLQKLEDIESIRFLLEHYIELNESHDYDAYSKLFAHDGELVMRRGSATGPVAIKAMLDKNFGGAAGSSGAPQGIIHVLSNIKIEVKGDTATATSRWIMLVPTNDNKPRLGGIGHYGDILVRENDEWKFKQRIIYRDIPADEKPKQQLTEKHWMYMTTHFESKMYESLPWLSPFGQHKLWLHKFFPNKFVKSMVGGWYTLKKIYRNLGYQRTPGLQPCKQRLLPNLIDNNPT